MVCVILVTLPAWLTGGAWSLFGDDPGSTHLGIGYRARGAEFDALLDAVFTLVQLIGLIAFIRGLFVLRAAADQNPGAGAGSAFAHMLGGLAAWHITAVIAAVQNTLGITVLQVSS